MYPVLGINMLLNFYSYTLPVLFQIKTGKERENPQKVIPERNSLLHQVGTATSNLNGPVPVNSNHRGSSIHMPLKEYEVPDFLKDTQPQRHHENGTSPVVKRDS